MVLVNPVAIFFTPIPLFFVVVGGAIVLGCVDRLRTKFALDGRETATTIGVEDGFIAVEGTIGAAEETVTAPFSGRDCVYYEALIENKRPKPNAGGTYWDDEHEENESTTFLVRDDYGAVAVDPTEADVRLDGEVIEVCEKGQLPSDHLVEYAAENDAFRIDAEDYLRDYGPLRFRERRIHEGDPVAVSGFAADPPDEYPRVAARIEQRDGIMGVLFQKPFAVDRSTDALGDFSVVGNLVGIAFGGVIISGAASFIWFALQ